MTTNTTAPLHGTTIEIGGATRTIRFTMNAHRIVKKRMGVPVKDAMRSLQSMDIDALCELAAAGLTEGRHKLSKEIVTPERVASWLDEEPRKVSALAIAVAGALQASFERMFEGEANAADVSEKNAAAAAASLEAMTTPFVSTTGGPTSEG